MNVCHKHLFCISYHLLIVVHLHLVTVIQWHDRFKAQVMREREYVCFELLEFIFPPTDADSFVFYVGLQ